MKSIVKLKRVMENLVNWLVFTKPFNWIADKGMKIRSRQVRKVYRDMGVNLDKNMMPQ